MSDRQQPEHEMDELLRSVRIEPAADFDQRLHARLRQSVEHRTGEIAAARANHRPARRLGRSPRQRTGLFAKDSGMKRTSWMLPVFAILILGVLLISFAAVILLPDFGVQPAVQPTETALPAPESTGDTTATPAQALGDSSACPAAQPGQAAYINQTGGYCFLYPEGWTIEEDGLDVLLIGVFHDLEHTQEGETAMLRINAIAEAGMTHAEFSDMVMGWYPGVNIIRTNTTVGGLEATVLDDIPSIGGTRMLIASANDLLYVIEMAGTAGDVVQQDADQAWALINESMTFFAAPPVDVVSAQEVCPQPTADTKVVLDRGVGFCLPVPAEAEQLQGVMIFYLGDAIPGMPDFVDPRASIGIGPGGPLVGRTITQIAQERGASSVTETTIAGYPAAIAESAPDAIVPNRIAYIVVGEQFYTVLVSPTDYTVFPAAQEPVERLWSLAVETIAFFEPWGISPAP